MLASCIFYMSYLPVYILVLFALITIDYFAAFFIDRVAGRKRKLLLAGSIISTCLVLLIFKYFNFFLDTFIWISAQVGISIDEPRFSILLPLGLSYHTFQSLSYVIEVYRGNFKPEKHYGIYALYVMFYPQMVAGPIERPYNLLVQLREKHDFDYYRLSEGLKLMAWGMFKKVVIADRIGVFVDEVYSHIPGYSGLPLWIASFIFCIQVYCDFSGYSDIAIGAARTMGFDLMTNFRRPMLSRGFADFWNRWHISLNSWFRDYVLFSLPLGRNRKLFRFRLGINLLFTFFLVGMWHGANWTYICWGLLMGVFLLIEFGTQKFRNKVFNRIKLDRFPKIRYLSGRIISIGLIFSSGFLFRSTSIGQAKAVFKKIISSGFQGFSEIKFSYNHVTLVFILIGGLVLIEYLQEKYSLKKIISRWPVYFRWPVYISLLIGILMLGIFSDQKFIYFRF